MSNKFKLVIIFIIIFFILFFLLNENKNININQTSQSSKAKNTKLESQLVEDENIKNHKPKKIVNNIKSVQKPKKTKYNSYLDLYEKRQLAWDCKLVFKTNNDFDKNIDPYTQFKSSVGYKSDGRQTEAKSIQIQALSNFLTQCTDLQEEVAALIEKNNYKPAYHFTHAVISYSNKRFNEAVAITEEEIELDKILKQTGKLANIQMSFGSLINGKSLLSKTERKEIENEINELEKLMYPNNNRQPFSEQDYQDARQQREALKEAIDQKRQYLKDSMYIDKAKLNGYRNAYSLLYPQIFKLLKTKYAYVFMEVYKQVSMASDHGKKSHNHERNLKFFQDLYPSYQSISDIVFNDTGFKYRPYFDQIYTPAKNLFLCYLGLDCSVSSTTVRNYCLGMNEYPMYFEACGKDLETFYYEAFLSANQLRDVNVIFEYLVNQYAQ